MLWQYCIHNIVNCRLLLWQCTTTLSYFPVILYWQHYNYNIVSRLQHCMWWLCIGNNICYAAALQQCLLCNIVATILCLPTENNVKTLFLHTSSLSTMKFILPAPTRPRPAEQLLLLLACFNLITRRATRLPVNPNVHRTVQ